MIKNNGQNYITYYLTGNCASLLRKLKFFTHCNSSDCVAYHKVYRSTL